ncbi:hypothetical protein F511_43734 [Dorcoceras hygrometricum]|uniref:Uncharacterized protein n=1 Tax=Dorcoceras hygrometricum TaxID=472368 RepID=A0A2Z7AI65_9LAMI|nr:hypothetical protein F511_43734 [Dorcoceras hygrometricum]
MNESDVDEKRNMESAMTTSAFLLEEAVISNDDVSIADWKKLSSATMTSAISSRQEAQELDQR